MNNQPTNIQKDPMDFFVEMPRFRKFCAQKFDGEVFEEDTSLDLMDGVPKGTTKNLRVLRGNKNKKIIVKEIRFNAPHALENFERTNLSVRDVQDTFLEMQVIRHIKSKKSKYKEFFPENYGLFGFAHPNSKAKSPPEIISMKAANNLHWLHNIGVSSFILEEYVVGRKPNEEELQKLRTLRAEGIKTDPKTWIAVDVNVTDVIIRPNGKPCFVDVGNFNDLNQDLYQEIQRLYFPNHKPRLRPYDLPPGDSGLIL